RPHHLWLPRRCMDPTEATTARRFRPMRPSYRHDLAWPCPIPAAVVVPAATATAPATERSLRGGLVQPRPTYWTSRAGQKPPSIVCAVRCELRRTTSMPCLISRYCFSVTTSTRRRRSTGGVISPMTLNLNGQHGHGGP